MFFLCLSLLIILKLSTAGTSDEKEKLEKIRTAKLFPTPDSWYRISSVDSMS